ncbi:GIY-YIG nuclease family protein [Mesorhizobium sp. A623]
MVKGLFNRVVKEDQWDWFTVARQLGYPSRRISAVTAQQITAFRNAVKEQDPDSFWNARSNLLRLPLRRCLSVFLGKSRIVDEPGAGWIYALSIREFSDLLKIGMTTRTVEQRAQEINGATGVAVPFGVRRCWRVSHPHAAEKLVHAELADFRLRNDREFFRIHFSVAAKKLDAAIGSSGLEIRTLDALAALTESD